VLELNKLDEDFSSIKPNPLEEIGELAQAVKTKRQITNNTTNKYFFILHTPAFILYDNITRNKNKTLQVYYFPILGIANNKLLSY